MDIVCPFVFASAMDCWYILMICVDLRMYARARNMHDTELLRCQCASAA